MSDTSEKSMIRSFFFIDFLPLEVISKSSRVDNIESFGVLDFSSKRLKLNDVILGFYIWIFLSVVGRCKFEVTDRSLCLSIEF